jgi:Protein of unknown function DUF262
MEKNKIVETFLQAQNRLVLQSSDLSLESIANMVLGKAINITPKYQRRERWNKFKESALIESFLLNIPVPPIFLAEDEYGKYSVIDGKQRITAIYNFIKNGERLELLEKFKEIEGLSFNDLPEQLNNALKIRPYIRVITLLKQSDPNLKYEVFNRLNTGGDKLLPQEVRNAAFEGDLNDMLIEESGNLFLRKQLNIANDKERLKSKIYKEMIDVEYVLRFFTLRQYWDSFPGNMKVAMDTFMSENYRSADLNISRMRKVFQTSMVLCREIFGDDAFKRIGGRNEPIQGIFDAQSVAISFFVDRHKEKLIKHKRAIKNEFKRKYTEDSNFEVSMRQFTSNIKQVAYRIGTMKQIIQETIKNG